MEPLALYELDIHIEFSGPMPEKYNKAAPEASAASFAAADAVRAVLTEHGFQVLNLGFGSRRDGTLM